jgi:hypothetical protein
MRVRYDATPASNVLTLVFFEILRQGTLTSSTVPALAIELLARPRQ